MGQLWNTCEMARREFKTNEAAGVGFLKMLIVICEDSRKMSTSRKDRRLSSPLKVNWITCSSLFRYIGEGIHGLFIKDTEAAVHVPHTAWHREVVE